MKKVVILVVSALMAIPVISSAQRGDHAIGLRFGGGIGHDAELTFQTPFHANRAELDLGFGGRGNYNYWKLTGIYQWVMPIESGFYWYLGVGPGLGSWSEDYTNDSGIYLTAALNAGIEYFFSEIPLQISIDTRPELSLSNTPDDAFGFGLALAIRYRF
ncbi:hypothetical protein ACT29H_02660 [Thermophagus sp. OGC60D27]|uniref:hypothetical protein n=1 Tax=Thermophagus sp. OGC60D27 TaxID=3458415 RepID=UPI0040379E62